MQFRLYVYGWVSMEMKKFLIFEDPMASVEGTVYNDAQQLYLDIRLLMLRPASCSFVIKIKYSNAH